MAWYETQSLLPFETPCTITLVASSNGGKTSFVERLLRNSKGMFTEDFSTIVYCYGSSWQPIFDNMLRDKPNMIFKEGLPTENEMEIFSKDSGHSCLIIDDLMTEINAADKTIEKLWTVHSHHLKMTIIYLAHNMYQKSPSARTISLNTQYYVLFKNLRDVQQIQFFGRQIYGNKSGFFNKAYQLATGRPWGYLLVDLNSKSEDKYRLRTNIFPNEDTIVFAPE